MDLYQIQSLYIALTFLLTSFIKESIQQKYPSTYSLFPLYLRYLENLETQFYYTVRHRNLTEIDPQKRALVQMYISEFEDKVKSHNQLISRSYVDTFFGIYNSKTEQTLSSNNPILSLHMIYRIMTYFKSYKIHTSLYDEIEENALPDEVEIEDAIQAIFRLQHFYELEADKISSGVLQGIYTDARLSARECFDIGTYAQELLYFNLALQWFDVALNKLRNSNLQIDPSLTELNENEIISAINETIEEHNKHLWHFGKSDDLAEMDHLYKYTFLNPIINYINYSDISHLSQRRHFITKFSQPGSAFHNMNKDNKPPNNSILLSTEANVLALCNQKSIQSPRIKSKLKCFLDTSRHPYWKINPLKIEVLHKSPKVIQIYDIVTDTWTFYLKSLAYFQMERPPQPPGSTERTAAYAWLNDTAIPEISIATKVELITGLNLVEWQSSDILQVAAYATGSHVASHLDSFTDESLSKHGHRYYDMGNRMSTFLTYLNEVEIGGHTVFPRLGISVKPLKNSALFWYTSLKNGNPDQRTIHAGCPVIKGQKWITTKFAHITRNILKRPCGLNPNA